MENVRKTEKALYFSNASGLYFRLTHEGICGWRLLASKRARIFDTNGAAQMLAKFLDEKLPGSSKKLSYIEKKNSLTVSEKNGTKVILSLGKKFSLKFCTKDGDVITELIDISTDGTATVMKGFLEEKEAIYGGGERLDVANKRGTAFNLYTCDGWNNSSTTYVVSPTFITTRGGGLFVNRNEFARVDFGKAKETEWSYELTYGNLDCYFYPTGSMTDVLRGYTELSGHAYMPAPWMQGMHICRYGPDNRNFDKDLFRDRLEDFEGWEQLYVVADGQYIDITVHNMGDALSTVVNGGSSYVPYTALSAEEKGKVDRFYLYKAEEDKYELAYVKNDEGKYYPKGPKGNPSGTSTKTYMEHFIREDMKPDAASLEGRRWYDGFTDKSESAERYEDLQRCIDWLHAHGMRAMVYIRVGMPYEMVRGFKPEFRLHADVDILCPDGTRVLKENNTQIPWVSGTGESPKVAFRPSGSLRTIDHMDITDPEAMEWYFDVWKKLVDMGIDGAKIDFCEVLPDGEMSLGGTVVHYHWKHPEKLPKNAEHHSYPTYFISLLYKRMMEYKKEKGLDESFMVFSRGGGIGSQRNPYMWSGDQARAYEKLDDQLLAVVTSGLSGIPFMSFDMGGYSYSKNNYFTIGKENESALFARATEFTAFLTQMQTHGDVRHAYEMTEEVKQIYRNFTRLHAELIPYMQRYSRIACNTGLPPVRHLVLSYPKDENVYDLNDEFMLGEGLLIAPILTENTFEREVYLPEGSWTNLLTGEVLTGGTCVKATANLGQIPVYLNNDSKDASELLPIFKGTNWRLIQNHK